MTTGAIIMMVLTMGTVTAFAVKFFIKVLRTPLKEGSDSYSQSKK
jgi:hypothetical protein